MPNRSRRYMTPAEWVAEGGSWPGGPFRSDTPDPVAYATHWSRSLTTALEGVNKIELCRAAEIKRDTLYDIINGGTWADTVTLAKLEIILGRALWPSEAPAALLRVR